MSRTVSLRPPAEPKAVNAVTTKAWCDACTSSATHALREGHPSIARGPRAPHHAVRYCDGVAHHHLQQVEAKISQLRLIRSELKRMLSAAMAASRPTAAFSKDLLRTSRSVA